MRKFKIGDKVVLNAKSPRLPQFIRDGLFTSQHRRVVSIHYDRRSQHAHYHLGINGRGLDISHHSFRASELKLYRMKIHTRRIKMQNQGLGVS